MATGQRDFASLKVECRETGKFVSKPPEEEKDYYHHHHRHDEGYVEKEGGYYHQNRWGNGWGWLGALILWFVVFAVLLWLIIFSLRPAWALRPGTNEVDTGRVLLASIIIAILIIIVIAIIKAFFVAQQRR